MPLHILRVDEGLPEWVIELIGVPAVGVFANGDSGVIWSDGHMFIVLYGIVYSMSRCLLIKACSSGPRSTR